MKSAWWGLASALVLVGMAGAASAGHDGHSKSEYKYAPADCGSAGGCELGVKSVFTPTGHSGGMTVEGRTPYDYFDSIHFQRAPHVSITRIHGLEPSAYLDDAPNGFTEGCHPESTTYCRKDVGQTVKVEMYEPKPAPKPAPAPHPAPLSYAPPPRMAPPVIMNPCVTAYNPCAPVMMAPPVQQERVVVIGKGYDPSKFAPRVYGDPRPVPGIAHVPTSIVDRDPVRAQQVLDSGRAMSKPFVPGGTTPALTGMLPVRPNVPAPVAPAPMAHTVMPHTRTAPVQVMTAPQVKVQKAPAPALMSAPVPNPVPQQVPLGISAPATAMNPMPLTLAGGSIPTGHPGAAGAPVLQEDGTYASQVGADGTYWEKVSGPTQFGDTVATQVICKRKLPTQVVNPVVGVPTPVPCPVPGHGTH